MAGTEGHLRGKKLLLRTQNAKRVLSELVEIFKSENSGNIFLADLVDLLILFLEHHMNCVGSVFYFIVPLPEDRET